MKSTVVVTKEAALSPGPGGQDGLRRNYLSGIENLAQSVGTMGPAATLGTVIPLLIAKSGNATWLLFLGVLGIFLLLSININVFAAHFASAGSLASYAERGLGRLAGVVTGWSYILALTFIVASSAVSSAYYLSMVATHFLHHPPGRFGLLGLTWLVAGLAWAPAYRDVRVSTNIMLAAEAVSVGVIVLIVGLAMMHTAHVVDQKQLHITGAGPAQVRLGLVLAFMMLAGFESATTLGEEAAAATSSIPRVISFCLLPTGALFLAGIYCVTALSHDHNLGLDQSSAPIDLIAQSIGLPALGWISSLGVALSCFGCALGGLNAGSRVIFSLARARQSSSWLARVHSINGTPSNALSAIMVVALVAPAWLILSGVPMATAMDYLMQLASFGFLGGYFFVCVAAPVSLARTGALTLTPLLVSVATLTVISAVILLSLFPLPDAPWRYLPYVFGVLLMAGTLTSLRKRVESSSSSAAMRRF